MLIQLFLSHSSSVRGEQRSGSFGEGEDEFSLFQRYRNDHRNLLEKCVYCSWSGLVKELRSPSGSLFISQWHLRFDIEGDDETQINFSAREGAQIPTSLIPSLPRHHDIPRRQR
uniref:Sister chromatid cohesion 1 protein 1 n=1 Tax=Noccaea caerulescens TaxID=107243 RepID=A0A1J3JPM1_NOCCA